MCLQLGPSHTEVSLGVHCFPVHVSAGRTHWGPSQTEDSRAGTGFAIVHSLPTHGVVCVLADTEVWAGATHSGPSQTEVVCITSVSVQVAPVQTVVAGEHSTSVHDLVLTRVVPGATGPAMVLWATTRDSEFGKHSIPVQVTVDSVVSIIVAPKGAVPVTVV